MPPVSLRCGSVGHADPRAKLSAISHLAAERGEQGMMHCAMRAVDLGVERRYALYMHLLSASFALVLDLVCTWCRAHLAVERGLVVVAVDAHEAHPEDGGHGGL